MSTKELGIINQGPTLYEFSSIFDGEKFYLKFEYNSRNDTWYLDVIDDDRVILLAGLACLTNVQTLIGRFVLDLTFITGDIVIADSSINSIDPSYDNFGDEVSAFYTSLIS